MYRPTSPQRLLQQLLRIYLPLLLGCIPVSSGVTPASEHESDAIVAASVEDPVSMASAKKTSPKVVSLPISQAAVSETTGKLAGKRGLALVVGIGQYRAVTKLTGPAGDAQKVYDLLIDPHAGYGFPKENVCLLLDEAATKEEFKRAFQQCLVDRAQDGDTVVVYFAGHGSISFDSNGDESDSQDETLMFVDARIDKEHFDLVDDELNIMLSTLFKKMSGSASVKPQNVVVMLDSCNSGTAARDVNSGVQARFQVPTSVAYDQRAGIANPLDPDQPWDGASLPGLVFLSAAIDGTSALERNGEGLFTKALLEALKSPGGNGLTYEQLILRMRPLVAAYGSDQHIDVQGGIYVRREVFGDASPRRPASYLVKGVQGQSLTLAGLPLPGWSSGAVIRIYDGNIGPDSRTRTAQDFLDPRRAKAAAVVDSVDGLGCRAHVTSAVEGGEIKPGDVAILVRPGSDTMSLHLRLTPPNEQGGIPEPRAALIRAALTKDPAAQRLILLQAPGEKGPSWKLLLNERNQLRLFDPVGRARITFAASTPEQEAGRVVQNLLQHARQKGLLQLKGEAGDDFVNDETVQVWLEPVMEKNSELLAVCPQQNRGYWDALSNGPEGSRAFKIPLCQNFKIHVKVSEHAKVDKLYVGGLILSSDGGIFGFPGGPDGNEDGFVALRPGEEWTFRRLYTGLPPIKSDDHLLIFGNREENKVEWSSLTDPAARRGTLSAESTLSDALSQYLSMGSRGIAAGRSQRPTTWTSTYASMRVLANSMPGEASQSRPASPGATSNSKREYTLPHYDIREFLPSNPDSALYRLLMVTHQLTNLYAGTADGPRYNQDWEGRWDRLSDEENLNKGIDCSRAIWFAFTRAGLPYNNRKGTVNAKAASVASLGAYLSTREMVDKDSLSLELLASSPTKTASVMRDQFVSCRHETSMRTGDVLVYRRTKADPKGRDDGHVVMVIDPQEFVAWGSHAWDANAVTPTTPATGTTPSVSAPGKKDSGVEYQQIRRLKKGLEARWEGWDSANMIWVDCWRHKLLIQEWEASLFNRPGSYDLEVPLKETSLWKKVPPVQRR